MDSHFRPYDTTYVVASNGENLSSDATWYPCPFVNPVSAQEEYFPSSPWNGNELAEAAYEDEELSYYGCGNWLREYQLSFDDCWGDGYSVANGNRNNEDGAELKEIEDCRQSEQHHESPPEHEEFTQGHSASDLSNPWYDLWFACGGKTESQDYTGQETTRVRYAYDVPETGVCESLFGYWPCLYRYDRKTCSEQ